MRRCNCRCNSCCRNSNCRCRNNSCCNMYENNVTQNNTTSAFPENYLYGYAYTPNQCMNRTYTPEVGLENGSLFPELVSPYSPGQSIDFIEYLRNGGM